MKQLQKYDVGYLSGQYTHAQADSPLDYIDPSDNEDDPSEDENSVDDEFNE